MRAGRSLPVVLVVLASIASFDTGASTPIGSCGLPLDQDDAGSGRDAGATRDEAVALPRQEYYGGIIGVPSYDGVDADDVYLAVVPPGRDDFMMDLWVPGAKKLYLAAQPIATLEVYPPDENAAPFVGLHVKIDDPAPGLWMARISATALLACQTTSSAAEAIAPVAEVGTYDLYYGCNPHCDQAAAD